MVTCQRCGASLDPWAPVCPYCGTQTQHGQQQLERQAAYQYQAEQAEQARRDAEARGRHAALAKKSRHAMIWSLVGLVTCCLPVAIVGLVMGLLAKREATRAGAVAPGASTVAVVLASVAVVVFSGGVALYVHESQEKDARVTVLRAQLSDLSAREDLDARSACALVEIQLLEEGYLSAPGINIDGFQCDGKLTRSGEDAVLADVRFRTSSKEKHVVAACLSRGSRWSVRELRADGQCGAAPAGSGSASAGPSPSAP